jgi:hypothetical protein
MSEKSSVKGNFSHPATPINLNFLGVLWENYRSYAAVLLIFDGP